MEDIILQLNEVGKQQLISKSKSSEKGRERFNKRNRSRVTNTVKSFNSIDMNKLFKDDILTVKVPVQGETSNYEVTITFGGLLEILRDQIERSGSLTFREISRAAIIGFNRDDLYVACTCEDFKYRFHFWAEQNGYNGDGPENRPARITNPRDSLGSSCKHILLVLNNTSWVLRVARVIMNYIDYMERHYQKLYADIIYPAIYGAEYEEPVQLDIETTDELDTSTDTVDKANYEKQQSTRFQRGNTKGVRFAPDEDENQVTIEDNPDDVI